MDKEKNVRIRMLKDVPFAADGINVVTYKAGVSYALPKEQAKRYLAKKLAEQDKAKGKSPETK